MADSSMSIGAYGSPYENGILGGGPGSLPSLVTNQAPGLQQNVNGMASPSDTVSAGGTIRRAAPEPNKRALYVGGLDQRVTEDVLQQIFATAGTVKSVKIIPDKNVSRNRARLCCRLPPQACTNSGSIFTRNTICHVGILKSDFIIIHIFNSLSSLYFTYFELNRKD